MKSLQQPAPESALKIETDLKTDKPAASDVVRIKHGLDSLRELLDRSCVASRYGKLSDQQKAMILYGAKLKPRTYIHTPLDSMTVDEREQIRQSIIALCDISNIFGRIMLTRDRFDHRPKVARQSKPKQLIQEAKDRH
ncbi:hypothetical protein FM037_02985 [Shewanella psychropiezotolerans]|uniref:Uncharacterized protein n=1 Tax=Shewanella psychropiezotolerans TaxID=2593655 RepID=A0ABX5WTH5_9GAMM|nr:hypothetical protein [Shewanella psychropiezotolerans]QDO82395.1 hypothetical protein FM037_02985 [Shewanella psychropiezotolerans]